MKVNPLPVVDHEPTRLRCSQWRRPMSVIVVSLLTVGVVWLTMMIVDGISQKKVANDIENMGGTVKLEPTWLGMLLRTKWLVNVTDIWLSEKPVTDTDLASFQHLRLLRTLRLDETKVTDSGLACLEYLSQIQTLTLGRTRVTDAGLVHLHGLRHLEVLELGGTPVTDAGLEHLEGLTQLRQLLLNYTNVTDDGLVHIEPLKRLEMLTLISTNVTEQGVRKIQQALPTCNIAWMPKSGDK